MTRILADLPDEDIKWLDARAAEQGKSRASVLREAVSAYKAQIPANDLDWIEQGFGLWARCGLTREDLSEAARDAEWVRPWDDAYDAVRDGAPHAFGADDDRERAHYLSLMESANAARPKPAT